MINDLNTAPSGEELNADVCIVGAGAAGITIACALMGSGLSVCLVESGGLSEEQDTQALTHGASVGHPMTTEEGRYRVFGGATSHWTGRCAELDDIDFEPRPWLDVSGWPFGGSELSPYYKRARAVCGLPEAWDGDEAAARAADAPAFDTDNIALFVWRYAALGDRVFLDWGKRNRAALERATDVRVLLHANLVAIETEANEAEVSAITVRSLSGKSARVRARAFVLCGGGIENARLLLANPIGVPGGPANRHDQVGRYFMQHPRGRSATLETDQAGARRLQRLFNIFEPRSARAHELGFALSPEAQRREQLLNVSGILIYEADPNSGWESAKAALRDVARRRLTAETLGHFGRAIGGAGEVAGNALRLASNQHAILTTREIGLQVDLEQAPNAESRVLLDNSKDPLGMPRARVDWRMSELERTTARRFTELLAEEFVRLGFGRLISDEWLASSAPMSVDNLAGTYHHIATTRMSDDPRTGAVDANCRLHGAANLYAAGCSVFATGGQANPTFTIVALALRLSDHLKTALA